MHVGAVMLQLQQMTEPHIFLDALYTDTQKHLVFSICY